MNDQGSSELLFQLHKIAMKYANFDPAGAEAVPKLDVDQWSSNIDIDKAKAEAESKLQSSEKTPDDNGIPSEESLGNQIDEYLAAHVSFTLSLLEKLCNAINDSGIFSGNIEAVQRILHAQEAHGKLLLMNDSIAKLKFEIVQLNHKLKSHENEKIRLERRLDKALLTIKEFETSGVSISSSLAANSSGAEGAQSVNSPQDVTIEQELRQQIAVLEKQLADSETAKAKVEMTLTERLARPLPQTEVQVADMRKSMDELRNQCKQRVSTLVTEVGIIPSIDMYCCIIV